MVLPNHRDRKQANLQFFLLPELQKKQRRKRKLKQRQAPTQEQEQEQEQEQGQGQGQHPLVLVTVKRLLVRETNLLLPSKLLLLHQFGGW